MKEIIVIKYVDLLGEVFETKKDCIQSDNTILKNCGIKIYGPVLKQIHHFDDNPSISMVYIPDKFSFDLFKQWANEQEITTRNLQIGLNFWFNPTDSWQTKNTIYQHLIEYFDLMETIQFTKDYEAES